MDFYGRYLVTPFVGVWIETNLPIDYFTSVLSHPSWVCGLKRFYLCWLIIRFAVTPFVGVWIETPRYAELKSSRDVTPFVGVWIETINESVCFCVRASHPSWVCGLKLSVVCTNPKRLLSHPSWVCGLKHSGRASDGCCLESHPSWVCGLKPSPRLQLRPAARSHPSWVCGLKHWYAVTFAKPICHTLRGCVD